MSDADFMEWIYERLRNVYGESVNADFMQRLRVIIDNMQEGE